VCVRARRGAGGYEPTGRAVRRLREQPVVGIPILVVGWRRERPHTEVGEVGPVAVRRDLIAGWRWSAGVEAVVRKRRAGRDEERGHCHPYGDRSAS